MKKRLLARIQILFFLLFICSAIFAQKKTITGKVTDVNTGAPLQGVSVIAKGTVSGTTTGNDGTFKIQVTPDVNTLVFSMIGYGIPRGLRAYRGQVPFSVSDAHQHQPE